MNSELKCESNKLILEHETPPVQNKGLTKEKAHLVVPDPQETDRKL